MILSKIRNSWAVKVVAMFLLLGFLMELLQPLRLYALTGGPSQPEMSGITPVSTDEMVDLFSGDFHYTIPLMTVPGPNGGYPINLNYNSGLGMDHEASWVGLGWNLNPGAINRQVRGVPDDFDGDLITKTYKRRDNNTFLFTPGGGGEVFGGDFGVGASQSKSFVYNTYNGISLSRRFGIAASYVRDRGIQSSDNKVILSANTGFNINCDSDNGVTSSFSMGGGNKNLKLGVNYGYNSKSGTYTCGTQLSVKVSQKETFPIDNNSTAGNSNEKKELTMINSGGGAVGNSFSTAANLPPINIPLTSNTFSIAFQVGGSGSYLEGYGIVAASICSQQTPRTSIVNKAYGLFYAENADQYSLQDFNREKELCVDQHSKNLPLPVMTYDTYSINGEQMRGSFRAFRSDYGHFFDNMVKTTTNATEGGGDVAFGGGVQMGASLSFSHGESRSGDWDPEAYCSSLSFKNKSQYANSTTRSISPSLYEPFYFKMTGEQTMSEVNHLDDLGKEKAVYFSLQQEDDFSLWGRRIYNYLISNRLSSNFINRFEQKERTKRSSNIEYKTGDQSNGRKSSHIKEFSVVNSNGERYTYGKTLYNHVEKEVMFSIKHQTQSSGGSLYESTTTKNYDRNNASGTTRVGKEKLYSCTETPGYAYSYLITSITSSDYVDANNNGVPDDADFGYWVKFNYTDKYSQQLGLYKWRFPYEGAHFFMGDRSNQTDDKGSYNYGTKEIAYVNKIETKTHYAEFYISERKDGLGVKEEYMGGKDLTNKLYKLDSIKLFSKEAPAIPIKTAVFVYDYSLCKNVPNQLTSGEGKLTLLSVYFKYAASEKGKENPYYFQYASGNNPTYNSAMMDRWGNYKGNANYFEHYVTQDSTRANQWAKSWLLNNIKLPGGGAIEIDYESDDYAYVQNKQAMYMAEIDASTKFEKEDGKYYIYFKKDSHIPAGKYVSGFQHNLMFFKIALVYSASKEPDYIQGYVEILPNTAGNSSQSSSIGRVQVKPFSAYDIHPIYFLALQYLKKNRPDLMFNNADASENQNDAAAFFRSLISGGVIDKIAAMDGNKAFYSHCVRNRDYSYLKIGYTGMPSYVRLQVPNKIKYGGGARVKAITMQDHWTKSNSSSYKQNYYYKKMEQGKLISSGVAEYEPTVGTEENALRYPVYDQVKGLFFVEDEMYSEEPYGESYFPAANVGYSQVIVKTYTPENVNLSTSGIQRHEFYTAADYPIVVSQTPLQVKITPVPNLLQAVTTGFKQVSTSAYSQGYMIELNDMHGKRKALSTCPYIPLYDEVFLIPAVESSGYTARVEYQYKTKKERGVNKVDNVVDVLLSDEETKKKILGQTYDIVIDQRENSSYSIGGGASTQVMIPFYYPPMIAVSAMPSFDSFEESVRSVVINKVIYNTGILEKTVASNNGSVIVTQNLKYDPYTGTPLLTTVTNEFNKPVYHYAMPAYWNYANMGNAAENYRACFFANTALNSPDAFGQYDVIMHSVPYTIKGITGTVANCWNGSGGTSNINLSTKEIIRSRFSNQLNVVGSSITSMTDPTDHANRRLPILEAFNTMGGDTTCFRYYDCAGYEQWGRIVYDKQNRDLYFFVGDSVSEKFCNMSLNDLKSHYSKYVQINGVTLPNYSSLSQYKFYKISREVEIRNRTTGVYVTTFVWNDPHHYFKECLDGVLQASAIEYKNGWNYEYENITPPVNKEYLGIPNIYRSLRSNLYVTDRKQEGGNYTYRTNVAYDGTFKSFQFFANNNGNQDNLQKPWTWTAEITKYSPFNFEIENVNALGIYSSALYGYKNSLATAVANNARYYEIGFDGFENDQQLTVGSVRGHIKCTGLQRYITSAYAHTGRYSLESINPLTVVCDITDDLSTVPPGNVLTLVKGKRYVFSCWVRSSSCKTADNLGIDYRTNMLPGVKLKEPKVDCWQRVEFEFEVPRTTAGSLNITLDHVNQMVYKSYYDDIRIMPADATLKSYVYDPTNYRLVSELDENNYATFYNYDEEGILVQIKKETVQGIRTLKTMRQSLKK